MTEKPVSAAVRQVMQEGRKTLPIRINLRMDGIKKGEARPERDPPNAPVPQMIGLASPVGNHVGKGLTPFQ